MGIDAVLIVRDEEDCLDACLSAIRGVVDGVVVVDTGSRDRTVDIARRHTDRVHTFAWVDDFAAARNAALSYSSADWVIQVDADEVLEHAPTEARAMLESFIASQPANAIGTVAIQSETPAAGGHARATSHIARVFSPVAYRYEGAIHEQLVPLGDQGLICETGLIFAHSGYGGDEDARRQKARRNIPLLRRAIAASPNSAYYPYQLGKAYFSISFHSAVASAMEKAHGQIQFDRGQVTDGDGVAMSYAVVVDLYTTWAYALASLGRVDAALHVLTTVGVDFPPIAQSADYCFAAGYTQLLLGDFESSEAMFKKARACGGNHEAVAGTATHRAAYHLGLVTEGKERLDAAMEWYGTALEENPGDEVTVARIAQWPVDHGALPPSDIVERIGRVRLAAAVKAAAERYLDGGNDTAERELARAWSSTL